MPPIVVLPVSVTLLTSYWMPSRGDGSVIVDDRAIAAYTLALDDDRFGVKLVWR